MVGPLLAALGPEILEQIAMLAGAGVMNKFMTNPKTGKASLGGKAFMGVSMLPALLGTVDRGVEELEQWGFDPAGRKSRFMRGAQIGALSGLNEDLEMGLQEGRARDIGELATNMSYLKPRGLHNDFAEGLREQSILKGILEGNTNRLGQLAVQGPPTLQEMAARSGITF